MSFDSRDIRRAMDVYTLDNTYLGTVLSVRGEPASPMRAVKPDPTLSSTTNGELFGPMPTQTLGNPGPTSQSASAGYATLPDDARPIARGTLDVGDWWGLKRRRTIPLEAVQTVSLERVVLRLRLADLQPTG